MALSRDTRKLRQEREAMRRRNEHPTPQERLQDREDAKEAARLFGSAPRAKS